jgi:hypothetical protein
MVDFQPRNFLGTKASELEGYERSHPLTRRVSSTEEQDGHRIYKCLGGILKVVIYGMLT